MQYSAGLATFTKGSQTVTFTGGTDVQTYFSVGELISPVGSNVWYQVGSVHATLPQITMVENYVGLGPDAPGTVYANTPYVLQESYTPNFNFPYPEQGDIETASIVKRAIVAIDAKLTAFVGGAITAGAVAFGGTGTFTQDAVFTYNAATDILTVPTLRVGNGAVGSPSLSFTNDTNSGLYRAAAGDIRLAIAGVDALRAQGASTAVWFNSTYGFGWGSSGIGTMDVSFWRGAAGTLDMRSGTTAQLLRVHNTYNTATNYERAVFGYVSNVLTIGHEFGGTGVTRAVSIKSAGAGSIALNTNATDRLTVSSAGVYTIPGVLTLTGSGQRVAMTGAATGTSYIEMFNTSGSLRIGVDQSAGAGLLSGALAYSSTIATVTATKLHLGYFGAVKATISASGVLIGSTTDNGTDALQITGTTSMTDSLKVAQNKMVNVGRAFISSGGEIANFSDNSWSDGTAWQTTANNRPSGLYQLNSGQHLWFVAAATAGVPSWTTIMRVDNAGFWKVSNSGTFTTGSAGVHEITSANAGNALQIHNTNAATPNLIFGSFTATAPNNSSQFFLRFDDTAAMRWTLASNGGLYNYSANNVNLSDEEVKVNWREVDDERYWAGHMKLRYGTFLYKNQTDDEPNLGLGARHTGSIFPELLATFAPATETEPERKGIYETDLMYLHGVVIQRLQREVVELKGRLAEVLSRLAPQ